MKGYFNDEAATAKAFSAGNGWFDTGDLGWRAPSEHLILSSVSHCSKGFRGCLTWVVLAVNISIKDSSTLPLLLLGRNEGGPSILRPSCFGGLSYCLGTPASVFLHAVLELTQLYLAGAAGVAGSHMAGHIVLTGRAKDTIVLSSGENVEPGPIEDACAASTYIQHMVLLGQDQRMLGALVMPAKEAFDELEGIKGDGSCLSWIASACDTYKLEGAHECRQLLKQLRSSPAHLLCT